MDRMNYPHCDYVWIAADTGGNVAALVTAGQAPIPTAIIGMKENAIAFMEQWALELPVLGEAEMLVSCPKPDSFLELGKRGFFVYDWTDSGKVRVDELSAYELICRPSCTLTLEGLDERLLQVVDNLGPFPMEFAKCATIDPRLFVPCMEPKPKI